MLAGVGYKLPNIVLIDVIRSALILFKSKPYNNKK